MNPKDNLGSGRHRLFQAIRDLVLPDRCMGCGIYLPSDPGQEPLAACFCRSCITLPLPRFLPPYCPCCGCLLPKGSPDAGDLENHLCESCLKSRPKISRVRAAFVYEGIIRTAVGLLKYKGRVRLAGPLSHYLFNSFEQHFMADDIDLVVPVPLHVSRAWERQFNQAVLLVRGFPKLFRRRYGTAPAWTVRADLLSRHRATLSQTGLHQRAREKNLKKAFAVKTASPVRGKRILLIDDVYTSGATCRAAASCLTAAGARQVDALVLARA